MTIAGIDVTSTVYVQKEDGGPIVTVPELPRHEHPPRRPAPVRPRADASAASGDVEFEILLLSGDPRFARR